MEAWKWRQRERKSSKRLYSRTIPILIMGIVLAMFATTAWGEPGKGKHRHDPKAKLEKMTKRLGLTEDQQAQILPILEEKHQKMQALHEQMKATREQASEKVESVLTPEQQEKYKKRREARKHKMKEYREKHKKGHKKKHKRSHGKGHKKDKNDRDEDNDDDDDDRD